MIELPKKCPHCDTSLEFIWDGMRFTFATHDDAFCIAATRDRVRLLLEAMTTQREIYEHHIASLERRMNRMLAKHGIHSSKDRTRSLGLTEDAMIVPPEEIEIHGGEETLRIAVIDSIGRANDGSWWAAPGNGEPLTGNRKKAP